MAGQNRKFSIAGNRRTHRSGNRYVCGRFPTIEASPVERFVCAAGIVSHYVGDACQPLHISYLFNGDPDRPIPTKGTDKKTGVTKTVDMPNGKGVHSAHEDDMVNYNVAMILPGIDRRLGRSPALPTFEPRASLLHRMRPPNSKPSRKQIHLRRGQWRLFHQ
jgi:hypothetical protein